MKKYLFAAGILCGVLAGCGGSSGGSDYTVMERQEGPGQVTYRVRVSPGLSQSEADAIGSELRGKESKETMVNIYDGERSVENMIYTCQGTTCYDAQPGR